MTVLIKNAQLIDGTGKAAIKADLLVKRKIISAIGNLSGYKADEVIDARGAYLAPGFIDLHTSADHYLKIFIDPSLKNFLSQGVTTIIGGQDGISLAPLVYGSLKEIEFWADPNKINVNWHSFGEFLKILSSRKLGVNFGSLIGFQTIYKALIGKEEKKLNLNEIKIFSLLLECSLKEGAFGFSSKSDYCSGEAISYFDIRNLLKVISKYKGIYATDLEEGDDGYILNRVIKLSEETGVRTKINHLHPIKGKEEAYLKTLEAISLNSSRADIFLEVYPGEETVMPAYEFLPARSLGFEKGEIDLRKLTEKFKNSETRKKLLEALPKIKGDDIHIIAAPQNEFFEGKSIREFSQNRRLTLPQGILTLIEATRGKAVISFKNIDLGNNFKGLINDRAIIASTDNHHPGEVKNPVLKFLDLIEKNKILPIEIAVYKLTGLPAQILNIKNRGVINIGYRADLVIFREGELRELLLNGQRVIKDGKMENIFAGEVLKNGF